MFAVSAVALGKRRAVFRALHGPAYAWLVRFGAASAGTNVVRHTNLFNKFLAAVVIFAGSIRSRRRLIRISAVSPAVTARMVAAGFAFFADIPADFVVLALHVISLI